MEQKKLLELKNDIVFQKIFGSQKNKEITSHLLSIILKKEIKNINLDVNKDLIGNTKNDKKGVLDVRATFNNGEDVDIEIQMNKFNKMTNRMLLYWSRMYSQKIKRGEDYEELKPSIVILISNYNLEETKNIEKYNTKWNIREEEFKENVLTEELEFHILELPKLKKTDIEKDELALWLKFISSPNDMEVRKEMEKEENKYLKQAMEELQDLSNDPGFERIVESREKFLRDQAQREKDSKRSGEEQGKKIGEEQKAKAIAKKMLEKGMTIDEIMELTELTKQDIEKLK